MSSSAINENLNRFAYLVSSKRESEKYLSIFAYLVTHPIGYNDVFVQEKASAIPELPLEYTEQELLDVFDKFFAGIVVDFLEALAEPKEYNILNADSFYFETKIVLEELRKCMEPFSSFNNEFVNALMFHLNGVEAVLKVYKNGSKSIMGKTSEEISDLSWN